jgi:hypothetical protein
MAFEDTRKLFNKGYDQVLITTTSHSEPDLADEQGLLSREKSCDCSLKRNATIFSREIKQGVLISVWLSVVCIALAMIVTSTLRERHDRAIDDMCFEHSTYYSRHYTQLEFWRKMLMYIQALCSKTSTRLPALSPPMEALTGLLYTGSHPVQR